jgi:tetratricopeptide (TPR) repeat protein
MGTLRSVVVFVGYSLIFGAVANGIDNAAHAGGLVTGLAFGVLIARVAPDRDRLIRRATALMVVLLAVVGGVAWLRHSRSYIIHVQRAGSLLAQNKADQAIAELQTAIRQRPDYMPAHFELAHAYSIKGDSANTEAELKRVIELDPQEDSAHYLLGFHYLDENRTQQAKDAFARILTYNADSAEAHFGLAMVAAAEGNHQLAIQEYQTSARVDPKLSGLYYNLGRSYAQLKMYDEAIAAYLKEQEQHGDDYDTQLALASAYQAKGLQQKAEDATRKAAQLKAGQ